ncbi:unnamed protein product [Cylindrotheca closterium]|uniref:Uncharacterized protein n=1 Tax=Cylindrotheca closterium TaxID=2856 RepID=A0AAD2CK98_9STRA|nr:unnamed protein product [Cylindrotheca closterium]
MMNKNTTTAAMIRTFTFFSLVVAVASEAWTQDQINYYYQKYNAPLNTCAMQAQCLKYTITENETPSKCGSPCEYRVCWHQGYMGEGWNHGWGNWGFLSACMRYEHVDAIGDMHTTASSNDPFDQCLNQNSSNGKGYWDASCTDPQQAFTSSYTFANVCQNVPAGQTVHFLINDGGSCAGTASKGEMTGHGTEAFCAPSTQDLSGTNRGGQTFFPAYGEGSGGTCSGLAEGNECVWSVTVPSTCAYEEGDPCVNDTPAYNADSICPDQEDSALVYYENDRNGDPPVTPIHDIRHNGDGTVSFRVLNPFGDDLSNIYTVMPKPGGHGDPICPKQNSATDCITDEVYTAQCIDDESWTFVTVFVVGEDDTSAAAQLVDTVAGSKGTEVYKCCPRTFEPNGRFGPQQTAAFSYLIHCACDGESGNDGQARALRVSNDLAEKFGGHGAALSRKDLEAKFLRGELFGDELKTLYGLL